MNINGKANVAVPSGKILISIYRTSCTSRSEQRKLYNCRPEQCDQCDYRLQTEHEEPAPLAHDFHATNVQLFFECLQKTRLTKVPETCINFITSSGAEAQ